MPRESVQPENNGTPARAIRLGLVLTNLIKVAGLALAIKEGFFSHGGVDPGVLIISAFMMSGAQGIEGLLDKLLAK